MKAFCPQKIHRKDSLFVALTSIIGGTYVLFLVMLLLADFSYTYPSAILEALQSKEIQYSIKLSIISCTITALLSLLISIPLGYLMSRYEFRFKKWIDTILDIPIILPPLVIGLSLLILFNQTFIKSILDYCNIEVTYTVFSVILAQFTVSCAFSVRTMYLTFMQIDTRQEQVALTLGCNKAQSFFYVLLPQAKNGIITAGTLAWARALGEFGPLLIFCGATRLKTEVLSVSVYLEINTGRIEAAVAVSLIMILAGFGVLLLVRFLGYEKNNILC